jgi:hypothetical protein
MFVREELASVTSAFGNVERPLRVELGQMVGELQSEINLNRSSAMCRK